MSPAALRCVHLISGDLWAGAEVATFHLLCELARRDTLDLDVIVLNEGDLAERLRRAGIPTTVYDESVLPPMRLARQVSRHIAARRPDVVHSHRYKENLLGALGAARCGAFHVRTAHGRAPALEFNGRLHGLGALLDSLVAHVRGSTWIAVSRDLETELRGGRRSVAVIPNGLPDELPRAAPEIFEQAFGDRRRAWHLGFVGRLEPIKRPDRFLEAVAALGPNVAGRPVRAVVAGEGSMRDALGTMADRERLTERVRFLGHRRDSPSLVAALDVLLIPSDHEGLPMVMLEAMRSGTPLVASAVGGLAEMLEGSVCLVSPDAGSLASRTAELLGSPELRVACSRDLRRRFAECGSIVPTADRVIELYRKGNVSSA